VTKGLWLPKGKHRELLFFSCCYRFMNVIQAFGCKDKELFVIIQILENKKNVANEIYLFRIG